MNKNVLDLDEVLERVQGDKELLLELFDIFTKDYEQKSATLKAAIAEKNFEVIKEVVHSIKGAAGNISAKDVHAACMNIESVAAHKNIEPIVAAMPVLDGHFKTLQGRMAEVKKEFSG